MVSCGSLMKSVLVAVILVVASGHPDEKLASCCKKVTKLEITEPILGYLVQKANPPCVQAVIFQTETGLYCSQLKAPWVLRKIKELKRAKTQTTASPVFSSSSASLLSIITSTASSPSSSTVSFQSSSTLLPYSSIASSPSSSTDSFQSSSTLLPSSFSSPPSSSSAFTVDESSSGSGEE